MSQIVSFLRTKCGRQDIIVEILFRIAIFIIFRVTDDASPFRRKINPEEVWLYQYPHTQEYFSVHIVYVITLLSTALAVWAVYKFQRDLKDACSALLGVSLSTLLGMTIANIIKLTVGRPRPDFFDRCYENPPEDKDMLSRALCDRPNSIVDEGYKSFPSGHSTLAFSCMAYLSLYLAWRLRVFNDPGSHYPTPKLLICSAPLICAALIAISRTCDYHHHWQDVLAGSFIGTSISYICYRQSYPWVTEAPIKDVQYSTDTPSTTVEDTDILEVKSV